MTIKSKIDTNRDKQSLSLRDNTWLLSRLDFIWTKYFADIPQTNKVFIKFGRFAKYRLGSIRLNKKTKASFKSDSSQASLIIITSMFKDPRIPSEVVDHTIGHELTHYAHGFSSNHPRLHKYPRVLPLPTRNFKYF